MIVLHDAAYHDESRFSKRRWFLCKCYAAGMPSRDAGSNVRIVFNLGGVLVSHGTWWLA